jgi:hypothetical protein
MMNHFVPCQDTWNPGLGDDYTYLAYHAGTSVHTNLQPPVPGIGRPSWRNTKPVADLPDHLLRQLSYLSSLSHLISFIWLPFQSRSCSSTVLRVLLRLAGFATFECCLSPKSCPLRGVKLQLRRLEKCSYQ